MSDWLVRQFTVGGITFQNWMVVALVIVLAWIAFAWLTRSMMRDSWYFLVSLIWLAIVLGWLLFVTFR